MEFNLIAMTSTGSAVEGLLNVANEMKNTSEEFKKVEENIKRLTIEKSNFERVITKSNKVIERAVNQLEILEKGYRKQGKTNESLSKKIKKRLEKYLIKGNIAILITIISLVFPILEYYKS